MASIQPQTKTLAATQPVHPPTSTRVAGGPPVAKAPVFDPSNPSTWGAGMSSAQLSAIVKSQIADAINPQVTGLTQQQSTFDQQQAAQQASLTGYYKALAGILQGEQPAVSSAYNTAAGTIGQIGQGLTGGAGAAMQAGNAADQAILQRGGQDQASAYIAAKANPGESALNPFYSEHGAIPATTLASQGAAKAAEAALQPGVAAAQGRDMLTDAISKAVAGDASFQQKIQDIYTQVPALRDKILTSVQQFETQQRQLHDTEVSLGIKNTTALQTLQLKQQTLTANVAKWNAQLQNSALDRNTRLQIAAQSRAAQKQLVVLRGQIAVQTAVDKKAAGVGTAATDPWPKVSANITKQAEYYWNHPTAKAKTDLTGKQITPPVHQQPQAVFNALWSAYVNPFLKSVPANQQATARKQAKQEILNAMSAAGFPLPGKK